VFDPVLDKAGAPRFVIYSSVSELILPILSCRPAVAAIAAPDAPLLIVLIAALAIAVAWTGWQLWRTHRTLRASDQRAQALWDNAREGLYEMSPAGVFTRANSALTRIFGYANDRAMVTLTAAQIEAAYLDAAPRDEALTRVSAGNAAAEWEARIRRTDGTTRWLREQVRAVRDEEGQLHYLLGSVQDITELRHANTATEAARQRYRALFDHLPIGIVEYDYRRIVSWFQELRATGVKDLAEVLRSEESLLDANARVSMVAANPATLRLFDLHDLDEGATKLENIYATDAFEARRKIFLALWDGRSEADGEFLMQAREGRTLRMIYHWRVPVIDGLPNYEHTQFVLVDVTEIKAAEQALASERERLSVTLRAMSEAVLTIDQTGIVQFMNEAAAELTGWPMGAAIGHPLQEVCVLGSDKSGHSQAAPLTSALSVDRPVDLPPYTLLRPREGPARSIEGRCAPVHDASGRPIGAVLVLRDVTHRSRLEADLLRASKMESIGVLAGGIAHDFNNLLSIVMGNLSLALLDEQAKSAAGKWLNAAERATLRARDLTHQLLTFAKGGEPVRTAVPLAEVVRETAQFALHGSAVRCEFDIADDLRPADADKGQISQVVQNLVINAVQAMAGGGSIKLRLQNETLVADGVATLPAGDYLRLEISDTGRGIPPEHVARIFEPFFTTKESGSGLGLATVYSVIQKHSGHIAVESVVGSGTTFLIRLPAAKVEPAKVASAPSAFEPLRGRVLFMDDEEQIRLMTKALLERLGLEVKLASDGTEAVLAYAQARTDGEPFDVVVFDLTIPGAMGGADAIREILKLDPQARGIVSSGYSSDPVMANFRAHGFKGSVPKPYRVADLSRILRDVMNGG
jgi:PAS domain S-box-containing protein